MGIYTQQKAVRTPYPCVADGSGNVSLAIARQSAQITRVSIVPDSGVTQPVGAFSVTLTDDNGTDILQGSGASCSNSAPTEIFPSIDVSSPLTLAMASVGASKGVTVQIYRK